MKRLDYRVVTMLCIAAMAWPALGQVNVGDTPALQFRAIDGQQVSLEALRGRIVLVDFWATWCGPCMAQADHKVEIHQKYNDKGLQIVGISLDSNQATLGRVVRDRGFDWPQYFDGQAWNNRVAKEWGVNSVPTAFLIDPDGKVTWRGHPGRIDAAIEQLFQANPPRLVDPQVLATAQDIAEQVEQAVNAGQMPQAIRLLGRVPVEAAQDAAFAERMQAVQQKVQAAAQAMFDEVRPLVESGNYTEAATRLQDLSRALAGTPLANQARQELRTLMGNAQARAAIEAAEKAARADEALEVAKRLQADGRHEQAFSRFRQIVREFAGTEAAGAAAEAVAAYEQDQQFVANVLEKAAAEKARGDLSLARSYTAAGRKDLARQRYQKIIDEYPGTSAAEQAQQEMKVLD